MSFITVQADVSIWSEHSWKPSVIRVFCFCNPAENPWKSHLIDDSRRAHKQWLISLCYCGLIKEKVCACARQCAYCGAIFGRPINFGIGQQMGYCQGTNASCIMFNQITISKDKNRRFWYFDIKDFDKSCVFYKIVWSVRLYYRVQGLVMMVKFIFMTAIKISKAVQNHVMKVSNLLKLSDENNFWNIQNMESSY